MKNHTLYDCIDVNLIANSYDGVDDSELASIINNNPELREHFKGRQPPLLSGTEYDVISNVGSVCHGRLIMAQHIIKDMVVIKISLQVDEDPDHLDFYFKIGISTSYASFSQIT